MDSALNDTNTAVQIYSKGLNRFLLILMGIWKNPFLSDAYIVHLPSKFQVLV